MIDKIINTFFSRILITAIMFTIVIINTNCFGAEGTGSIALVILGLTILQLFSNFIGGGTIVYLAPRKSFSQLIALTYFWSLVSHIVGVFVLYILHLIPEGFEFLIFILAVINSLYFINISLMQAKEKIRQYNNYQIVQSLILILTFCTLLFISKLIQQNYNVKMYVYALIVSYLIPLIFSFRFVVCHWDTFHFAKIGSLYKEMFRLGFWVQLANFTQLMNYRLNYYFIEFYAGRKPLGIFELGTKLSEVIWIFPKSIALVQYAKLANCEDAEYAKKLTLSLQKLVFCFTLLAVILLMLIPAQTLAAIFGEEFYDAKSIIYRLMPGIISLSCLTIFAHHFSGFGKYWVNTCSSAVGFLVTLTLGLWLIPSAAAISTFDAIKTAAIITSISYFSSLLFSLILFFKETNSSLKMLLITKNDYQILKTEIINLLKKSCLFRQPFY